MSSTSRIVRHVRLRAAERSALHRSALLLQDAMRTASLPDAGGRIVLVQKLALGRIDSRAPPQTLALALERAMARLATECVYAATLGAMHAAAVWFRDALDAHTRLALRLASGAAVDAWYWPLAVPAWQPVSSRSEALRQIAFSVAALPEAPTALPQWAAAMVAAGHAKRLLAALRAEDVTPLAQAARLRIAAVSRPQRHSPHAPTQRSPEPNGEADAMRAPDHADKPAAVPSASGQIDTDPRRALVRALLRVAGAADERVIAAPPLANRPVRAGHSSPTPRVAREAPRSDSSRARATDKPARPTARPGRRVEASSAPAQPGRPDDEQSPPGVRRTPADTEPAYDLPADATAAPREPTDNAASPRVSAIVTPGDDTCAGGLLFLLPVLQRLHYAEWLDAEPQWQGLDIADRVLAAALTRLCVAPDDPAWQLATTRRIGRLAPRRFVAPPTWREQLRYAGKKPCGVDYGGERSLWDGTGRLLLGAWTGPCPRPLLSEWRRALRKDLPQPAQDRVARVTDAWIVAARRWLRRHARIGVWNLVLRKATLSLTPTHADLWFDLRSVDLRIRRVGLDIDPGWVPWFGRVVTFHYDG